MKEGAILPIWAFLLAKNGLAYIVHSVLLMSLP